MINKIALTAIALTVHFTVCNSQEVYNLNRCITEGLNNNYSIIIAHNRETISQNNYTPGNAGLLPVIDLTGRYSGTINNSYQNLTDGTTSSSTGINNTVASSTVGLTWGIFKGFNARTTYRKLDELMQLGELNTQASIENLVADIASEYYYFIQQKRLYKNLEFAVSLSRERVRIDQERYLLGAASKLQLLQSKVYLNADSSRLGRQTEILRASEIRLNELMAVMELDQALVITDTLIAIIPDLEFDDLLNETLNKNSSLLIARKNTIISSYDYKIIASRSYPYLNLNSGYNFNLNTYESSSIRNQQTNGLSYGVTFGVGLFDGYNKQRDKRNAKIELDNKEIQYLSVEQQIKADLLTIYYGYLNNLRLLKLEEENIMTASENLQIAMERYKLGNLSGLELREVQKSLLDAEERLLSVQFQTKSAEISLLQISGRIMEYL